LTIPFLFGTIRKQYAKNVFEGCALETFYGENTMEYHQLGEVFRRIVEEEGFVLYEYKIYVGKKNKRVYVAIDHIDRRIDISDCERVSKRLEEYLDQANPFESAYVLEVSSPGAERELRNIDEYNRFVGELAKIILKEPFEKRSVFIGKLIRVNPEDRSVEILERDSARSFTLRIDQIKKGNLYLEV
jgi:ribosome maturation factor RimP